MKWEKVERRISKNITGNGAKLGFYSAIYDIIIEISTITCTTKVPFNVFLASSSSSSSCRKCKQHKEKVVLRKL